MVRVCAYCGKELDEFMRDDAKFCDDKCRVMNHRKQNSIELNKEDLKPIFRKVRDLYAEIRKLEEKFKKSRN